MGRDNAAELTWRLDYTDPSLEPLASGIADGLQGAQIPVPPPVYKEPTEATLGAPEVIITILVSAAVKSVVITSLHVIQRYLESKLDERATGRIQIVLPRSGLPSKRFPLDIKSLSRETLRELISQVTDGVKNF
jgi:hypothetical protein